MYVVAYLQHLPKHYRHLPQHRGLDSIHVSTSLLLNDPILCPNIGRVKSNLTVDRALELLAADLAVEVADAGLLVELDDDGSFVVAEEACEDGGEGIVLVKDFEQVSGRSRKKKFD